MLFCVFWVVYIKFARITQLAWSAFSDEYKNHISHTHCRQFAQLCGKTDFGSPPHGQNDIVNILLCILLIDL